MALQKNKIIKILVTGSDGQLGRSLNYFNKKNKKFSLIFKNKKQLDIVDKKKLDKFIIKNEIKIIINTAAYTNVNLAENNTKLAFLINSVGPKNLALISSKYNIILIHFSTDYIFDGNKKLAYTENDNPNPLSVYGKSKLEGEKNILENCNQYIIIRLAWLYGPFGNNFFTKIFKKFYNKKKYSMIGSQYSYPASSLQLSKDIVKVINIIIKNKNNNYFGIFHYGPFHNKISRYNFTSKLASLLIKYKKLKNISNKAIIETFYMDLTKNKSNLRPSNSMLNNNKFFKVFKLKKHTFTNNLELSIPLMFNKKLK